MAYSDKQLSYARTIIQTGQSMGVSVRGIRICLAAALVETNILNYANRAVPGSLTVPYDAIGSDSKSVGILQQQPQWWGRGDGIDLMDPATAARLFYEQLLKLDYNGSNSPGSYAQAVQRSAYPNRYDERFAEATSLYDSLVSGVSTVANAPTFRDVELMGNNRDSRYGARVIYIFLHTEEGASASAEALVRSGNASGAFSYHNIFDDNTRVAMVDTDYGSWSVLDANAYSINYCFAGSRAAQSRDVWLSKYRNAIRIAAWTAVEDIRKYSYIGKVVNPGQSYPKGRVPCVADHYFVTKVLGIGTHTDVGPNFPWDVFTSDFNAYLSGAAAPAVPPVNKINQEADRAKAWIGARKDKDEQNCRKDGGKFVRYDNAVIYWSPASGAHAIPAGGKDAKGNDIPDLMSVYAKYDWENGFLGFPVGDHTVLTAKDGSVIGGVQGFQGGAIYRKKEDGKWLEGWPICGRIRDQWNKSGFENGPWGWPVSPEFTTKSGAKYQVFEGGRLAWAPPSTYNVLGLLTQDGQDTIV